MTVPIDKFRQGKNGNDVMRDQSGLKAEAHSLIDYEKIRSYMVLTDWYYRSDDHAPSIEQLKQTVEYLIEEHNLFSKNNKSATGGFALINQDKTFEIAFDIA